MIHGRLPDYPEPAPRTKRQRLLDIKAELEDEIAKGDTDEELSELQDQLKSVNDALEEI